MFGDLLDQIDEPIKQVSADGAYDNLECYEPVLEREAKPVIPPRINAIQHPSSDKNPGCASRNQVIRIVAEPGSQIGKQKSDYYQSSLAETAMFQIKTWFGNRLKSRKFESQAVEAFVRCVVLNRMTSLGLPDSYPI